MKGIILFFSFFLVMGDCFCQVIKVDNGLSISHFNTKEFSILQNNISSYCGFIGIEYLNKKWFYLSSEIGYIKIGGRKPHKNILPINDEEFNDCQINTTFRIKNLYRNVEFYLGVGPYLNFLLGPDNFSSSSFEGL